MKSKLVLGTLLLALAGTAAAQVPPVISYQGRLQTGGTNSSGTGQFKFALVSPGTNVSRQATATATVNSGFVTSISVIDGGAGYTIAPTVTITDSTGSGAIGVSQVSGGAVTNIAVQNPGSGYSSSPVVAVAPPPPTFVYGTFWSNDGTSSGGNEPVVSVPVPVQGSLFTVFLGDTNLPNMQSLPTGVFTQEDVRLRVWLSDGVNGFVQLTPDQRLGSVGYAMMAAQVSEGAINATGLANDSVTAEKLATNAVTTERIQDGTIAATDLNTNLLNGTFWKLGGNGGTNPTNQFVGTTDRQALELKVEGRRALRLEPATNADPTYGFSPNVIGGFEDNSIAPGVIGATIAGGGRSGLSHRITAHHGTIAGGGANVVSGTYSFIGGGLSNTIGSNLTGAVIPGGVGNSVAASYSFAAGHGAIASHPSTFVWSDGSAPFGSTLNNQFIIQASGGVGIGTNRPFRDFHVAGNAQIDSFLVVRGTVSIAGATSVSGRLSVFDEARLYDNNIWFRDSFDNNHGVGWYGSGKLFGGTNVNGPVLFGNDGGALGRVSGANQIIVLRWTSSGRVGIGRHPVANILELEGNASKTASGSWLANSDARIKTGVLPVRGALEKLSQVRLVSFRYTDEYRAQHPGIEEREYLNVIAQEFQKVFPEHVKNSGEKLPNGDGILQVDTHPLTIYSAAAIQELHAAVKEKDAKISNLEKRLARLESLVSLVLAKTETSTE